MGQGRPPLFSPEQSIEIRNLYDSGNHLVSLSAQYKCSIHAIRTAIIRAGGEVRPVIRYIKMNWEGKSYHNWTVIIPDIKVEGIKKYLYCECKCGHKQFVEVSQLTGKRPTRSCLKCYDLKGGTRYGKLTIIGVDEERSKQLGTIYIKCSCDCGNIKSIIRNDIANSKTKSCGCLVSDNAKAMKGKNHPNWRGGKYKNPAGYIILTQDYNGKDTVLEHVYIMSKHIRRVLRRGETVHHKNGIKTDNRIKNLELWASRHPSGQRAKDLLKFAREIIAEYGDLPL